MPDRLTRSVSFDSDVAIIIEDYRKKHPKIPSFTEAVNDLIRLTKKEVKKIDNTST